MSPTTLPEQKVLEQDSLEHEEASELNELKISAQIMGYHAAKTILPALAIIVTLACGITLSVWAIMQLDKLPTQAFPGFSNAQKDSVKKTDEVVDATRKQIAPQVVHPQAKKAAVKTKQQTKAYKKRQASRYSSYQDPWAEYYYYAPSHPRGGEITHSDGMITEYSWSKKK